MRRRASWVLILTLLWLVLHLPYSCASFLEDNFPASVIEDARLDTLGLLAKYNHPAEAHQFTTEDKYILTVHRIPRPGAKPVLLVHGLEDSSATWILMGPHSGLGYYLYAQGYDVWMGNVRGNRYSRSHEILDPSSDNAFWSFSWHEIGLYDLPAMIDGILAATGFQKLSYFGHSQGTTSFFVMASSRPEYNDKIHLMSALAPVAFMTNIRTPLIWMLHTALGVIGGPANELLPHSDLLQALCLSSSSTLIMCVNYYFKIVGENRQEFNLTTFPIVLGHIPAGCSAKQPVHYLQLHRNDRFCQFDYRTLRNSRIYGQSKPPDYPLEKVSAPVALYYGQNDYLSDFKDVKRLIQILPNVVLDHMYPDENFNHMDMMWGTSVREMAQPQMLRVMQQWENGGSSIRKN